MIHVRGCNKYILAFKPKTTEKRSRRRQGNVWRKIVKQIFTVNLDYVLETGLRKYVENVSVIN